MLLDPSTPREWGSLASRTRLRRLWTLGGNMRSSRRYQPPLTGQTGPHVAAIRGARVVAGQWGTWAVPDATEGEAAQGARSG